MPLCAIEASANPERKGGELDARTGRLFLSSWPGLIRPSTSFAYQSTIKQAVDARDKRGHDESIVLLGRPLPADRNLSFV